eukprot:NODE_619_length_703_cov_596.755208_g610_i0.p1 GENE.NODE_619_length_703_cov_596.755208_g610_i0~~NODE_619_length_703_cov_596.755208_g610_i0.p1  ORF type:complete len:148 (+),score=40.72 NODE_619_length_703_cov_596.755208_g610_i0:59-502(+)
MMKLIAVLLVFVAVAYSFVPTYTVCSTPGAKLKLDSLTWVPHDLKKGDKVELTVKGTLEEEITKGDIAVKASLDGIPLLNKKFDLCTEVKKINISCPIQPTTKDLVYNATLPSVLPVGKLKAEANVYDQNGDELFCIKGGADIPPQP